MNETEVLFTEILKCDRSALYMRPLTHPQGSQQLLDSVQLSAVAEILKRRIFGEPLQYILGKTEFAGLIFKVNPSVLIPRPETEILLEASLKFLRHSLPKKEARRILDMCTGSGCIAVSLAKDLPDARIDAVDISPDALFVARENARFNNVTVNFFQGDLFSSLPQAEYELIVSNPPYIPSNQIENLQPEVRSEPRLALDGGEDGMDFYRRLAETAGAYLKNMGYLVLEIGSDQLEKIKNIFQNTEVFEIIEVVKDYRGFDRVIVLRRSHG